MADRELEVLLKQFESVIQRSEFDPEAIHQAAMQLLFFGLQEPELVPAILMGLGAATSSPEVMAHSTISDLLFNKSVLKKADQAGATLWSLLSFIGIGDLAKKMVVYFENKENSLTELSLALNRYFGETMMIRTQRDYTSAFTIGLRELGFQGWRVRITGSPVHDQPWQIVLINQNGIEVAKSDLPNWQQQSITKYDVLLVIKKMILNSGTMDVS